MLDRLPIRWRLTLWYAALLGAALLLFGVGLYAILRLRLYQGFDEQLHNQAAVTLAAVRTQDGVPALTPAESGEQEGEYFARLLGADGRVVVDTGQSLGGVQLDPALVTAALVGQTRYSSVAVEENETLRIVTVPIRAEGTVVGALQVGLDRDELDEALAELLGALALAGPLVLLVAAGGGYLLAGRALRPVATITALDGRIGGQDLHARLNLNLPDDELGRLARTFDGMLARIEDAFERQRRFAGDAAHELRTPLSLMRSQVDLALARPRSLDEHREALRGLDGDLERLTGLVGTLLALARADTGRLVPDRAPIELADTVGVVLEQYAALAAEAGVVLRDESSPTSLVGDEDLLVQVLVNLIDNALVHTARGGTVTVGCRADDGQMHLWVADTGAGIALEHQARVFDRFNRVDVGRARAHGGTGQGLAICRAIAEAHGGTISLTSVLDKGTRVELWLPRRP